MFVVIWDESKRLANLRKHGLDFSRLQQDFGWIQALTLPAKPSRTGRERLRFVGRMADVTVVAVVSPLGRESLSLTSLRPASRSERRLYEQQT